MIWSLFLDRNTFAARRRKVQDDAVEQLLEDVTEAVKGQVITEDLAEAMQVVYEAAYLDEIEGDSGPVPDYILTQVTGLIERTTASSNLNATTLAIANLLINAAAMKAAVDDEDDLFLEWVTMHDGTVRKEHADTDGQVRPVGEKFDVSGVEMSMPGDVTAPIELWINCRCVLRPTFPEDFHVREITYRDVSKDERDRRAKDGTAMPDGSYPIANCSDLRNAIQAIGRAKDPAKVKAHIKKRKRALGCPDVDIPDSWSIHPIGTSSVQTGATYFVNPATYTGTWTSNTTSTGDIVMTLAPPEKPGENAEALERLAQMDEEQQAAFEALIPWHGVLAPEGVKTGDGRMFAENSLRTRDLPLPLTYQKSSDDGHKGSVTVGSIETIERVDGLMLASGYFLSTEEADEVVGLLAHFGKYGVSVDTDDVQFEFDEAEESVTFTDARICSASVVSIPAFAEAYITLGPWEEDAALVASGAIFKDLAPGRTEDGPGWLTHPIDTDRLRDYWVRGPGAAKIGWGTPGDFNRCRLNLAQYVKPQYLSGYCANRHYDALGTWPGRGAHGAAETEEFEGTPAPIVSLVAAANEPIKAPAGFFTDPEFTERTHFTVLESGEVFGHVAEWGVCHIGIQGVCVTAPENKSGYAAYANKSVLLDDGTYARTGVIHLGGKHMKDGRFSPATVTQHYDDTSRAVADVAIGQDQFGIWVHGWVRPGTSPEDVVALRASDISGDWREIDRYSGQVEMIALLAVNAGGLPVRVAADEHGMASLVAAGMIHVDPEPEPEVRMGEIPDVDKFADALAKAFERVEQNKKARAATMASLREKYEED